MNHILFSKIEFVQNHKNHKKRHVVKIIADKINLPFLASLIDAIFRNFRKLTKTSVGKRY